MFALIYLLTCLTNAQTTWPDSYIARGTFTLPYASLQMQFQMQYSAGVGTLLTWDNNLQKQIQNVQLGMDYTVMMEKDHFGCEVYNDTGPSIAGTRYHLRDEEVLTTVLPDLSAYANEGFVPCPTREELTCTKHTLAQNIMGKENNYAFYTTQDARGIIPIYFDFIGYDDLFGSHYDHYVAVYEDFSPTPIDPSTFDPPGICSDAREVAEPNKQAMQFGRVFKSGVEQKFHAFMHEHSRMYAHWKEYEGRLARFHESSKYIEQRNQLGLPYKLGMTKFGDRFKSESMQSKGLRIPKVTTTKPVKTWKLGDPTVNYVRPEFRNVGDSRSLDWRMVGAVSPVKDQAVCGSCWTFGTTGALEGTNFLASGNMTLFSEQYLVDCAWSNSSAGSNMGCDGGFAEGAYTYIRDNGGIPTEDSYRHYMGVNGICEAFVPAASVSGYVVVTPGDEEAVIASLQQNGPHYVAIDASHNDFSFYVSGVYYNPECKSDADDLDHAVLAVGFGSENDMDYWLIKNSWSTYWGDEGYVKMARKDNNCGVATDAVLPVLG